MDIANICRERRKRREKVLKVRSMIAQKQKDKKTIRPASPRYDEVYFEGVAALEACAFEHICEPLIHAHVIGDTEMLTGDLEFFSSELTSKQEPLGSEFEQVLHENLLDLYQE